MHQPRELKAAPATSGSADDASATNVSNQLSPRRTTMAITRNSKGKKVAILFGEGDPAAKADLGNKGAGLAELVSLGIPVPPFFTVTTSVARAFAQHQRAPRR